jgi:hypothetical protein
MVRPSIPALPWLRLTAAVGLSQVLPHQYFVHRLLYQHVSHLHRLARHSPTPAPSRPGSTGTFVRRRSGSCRSCNALAFRCASRFRARVSDWCFGFFGPSLHPHYRRFSATTASADFSPMLIREISPGKVLKLSARAVRLYPMRSFGNSWISCSLAHSSPRTRPHCLFVFLRSCLCYTLLSGWPHGFLLAFRYGCRYSFRLPPFRQQVLAHAGHTRAHRDAPDVVVRCITASNPSAPL